MEKDTSHMKRYFDLKGYTLCRRPILAPRGCHSGGLVRPSWHPEGPCWQLGSILEMGAAGWSRGGLAHAFHRFWNDFGTLF